MAIIFVSRGTYAGGKTLADMLGARLKYRVVSRELLFERVQETFGIVQHKLEEMMVKAPPIFDTAAKAAARRAIAAVQASLCELIGED